MNFARSWSDSNYVSSRAYERASVRARALMYMCVWCKMLHIRCAVWYSTSDVDVYGRATGERLVTTKLNAKFPYVGEKFQTSHRRHHTHTRARAREHDAILARIYIMHVRELERLSTPCLLRRPQSAQTHAANTELAGWLAAGRQTGNAMMLMMTKHTIVPLPRKP